MLEVKDTPTHRTNIEVDRRLYQYAWVRHNGDERLFNGLTYNDLLDELLAEVGF